MLMLLLLCCYSKAPAPGPIGLRWCCKAVKVFWMWHGFLFLQNIWDDTQRMIHKIFKFKIKKTKLNFKIKCWETHSVLDFSTSWVGGGWETILDIAWDYHRTLLSSGYRDFRLSRKLYSWEVWVETPYMLFSILMSSAIPSYISLTAWYSVRPMRRLLEIS